MNSTQLEVHSRPTAPSSNTAANEVFEFVTRGEPKRLAELSLRTTSVEVQQALKQPSSLESLAMLLSPAAAPRLEEIATAAHQSTLHRWGKVMRLFAPLYLSNECVSVCTYCGFSATNEIARRTLDPNEVEIEARELARRGFRHILLVSGEHPRIVSPDYVLEALNRIEPFVPAISIELQPFSQAVYQRFVNAGADGVVVYQETYDLDTYAQVHQKGKKRNYVYRLEALDRAAAAGVRRLSIGALLGLDHNWRAEVIAMAAHARALIKRQWRCEVSAALPRIKDAAGGYEPRIQVTDRELAQTIAALRLFNPDLGITLSTREPAQLRDGLANLGVTTMSAGSHTEPGGYATQTNAEPQFKISDERSEVEVAKALRDAGFDPVFKDWQRA